MSAESPAPTEEKKQEKSPTPVFGSSSTFGTATGFAGFSPEAAASKAPAEDGGADQQHEEEECQATFKPVVELDEVETTTGEEMETQLLEMKCKLYRYDPDASEWKERGVGHVRLLENKDNKKIRLLMRQEKTLKIRANHIVMPGTRLEEHSGSDKTWVYTTVDFAEEEMKSEMFAIRFGSVEKAQEFKTEFEKAMEVNAKLIAEDAAAAPTDEAAEEKEKLAAEVEAKAKVEDGAAA
uniref:Ran-binding protein 1 n=1 Tax=Tetraselmis sp. GSL018 TaxID=582737 RepID=A0A061S635_9CHLO